MSTPPDPEYARMFAAMWGQARELGWPQIDTAYLRIGSGVRAWGSWAAGATIGQVMQAKRILDRRKKQE